ncbi:hypothetical protein [Shewanella waksmanii]|uniref:hypothetical protein n=1 Tax=Shewanella waksmanii TaxID=213783 RepID=UPI0012F791A1|nr:hypothetical protein [Shewanella waksmanii]
MLRMIIGVMFVVFCSKLNAQPLEVIAVDYPYFTEQQNPPEYGVAFKLLRQALKDSGVQVQATFLPPARAHQTIKSLNWCASFYPAPQITTTEILMSLSEEPIQLGLYRKRQPGEFSWRQLSELKGKQVAYLRALSREGIGKLLQEAQVELFNTETINQGMLLLTKGRVDYAFGDKYSGEQFFSETQIDAANYQFSTTFLRELTVGVWLNMNCEQAVKIRDYLQDKGFKLATETP